jgi:hypothetical protein
MFMVLVFLPYVLQLLCVIHIIKTHQNTYWIWIVVFVPYIGGIAYLIIELIPNILNADKLDNVKDSFTDLIKPDQKFELIKQKAMYSSTFKNMLDYADALVSRNEPTEALGIYNELNVGAFLNDPELMYRIANALYINEEYEKSLACIESLINANQFLQKKERENILYLRIIEKLRDDDYVKAEYKRVLQKIQNNTIELPYIDFLVRINDKEELQSLFSKIHYDEQSMKISKVRYNKAFYRSVYQIENKFMKSNA